jgi:iron(III) transport system permease protein
MSSVLFLEQPGRWRIVAIAALLLVAALPLLPLWEAAFVSPGAAVGEAFWRSLGTSGELALGASLIGFILGLPLGVGGALTAFPGKRFLFAALSLPLVVPSFLWAIGWSTLGEHSPLARAFTEGFFGCLLVAVTTTTALVVFASYAGVLDLSRSQLESALLAGGERTLLRSASRHALLPAVLAAALGAVLTLSDSGPGQILGVHTVAAEILTSFAARYDLALAAKQCSVLTLVVATLALPLARIAGPRIAQAVLARQLGAVLPRRKSSLGIAVALGCITFLVLGLAPPVAGLLMPLASGAGTIPRDVLGVSEEGWADTHLYLEVFGALPTATRTAFNTILYACGAGVFATLFAAALALAAGRSPRLRIATLSACVVLFSWPSVASALAVAQLGSSAPPALDLLFRSRLTVCLVLALHLAPVATVLLLRATGAVSPSWTYAAAVHGVGFGRYFRRVLWPALMPSAALSLGLVALLASADAGSVLLLHPPGESSLALTIVTVMANAPAAFVAALCLIYLLSTIALLVAALALGSSGRRGESSG